MSRYRGKFLELSSEAKKGLPLFFVFVSFLLVELFGLIFLMPEGEKGTFPMQFGLLWSSILTVLVYLFLPIVLRMVDNFLNMTGGNI